MSQAAKIDGAIPPPPKRSTSALAFDTLLWGGVILLLIISFKPAEIDKFPQLFTDTDRTGNFAKLFFKPFTDPALFMSMDWNLFIGKMWQTIQMALWGTALAIIVAIPLGLLGARNIAPVWVQQPVRRVLGVLEQVCRQLQRWQGEGCRLLPVAINLSALDIVRPDIVHRLGETLARHHIPPALVEIEITETGLIRDERLAVENAQALRERGFALLIDDFGTGYSSLSKLNEFPVSAIKIDRSFIADLPGQEKKALIVKSILSLSRVLGCATVAEGVETREQLDFLTALGCTAYQGYYFHRPLPATTAGGLLERQPGPAPGEALMSPLPA